MKIIAIAVVSLNGKITRGFDGDIYEWSSPEDKKFFADTMEKNNLIVMGSGTFTAVRNIIMDSLKPDKLRVVLTKNPADYESDVVPNSLEFSSETPKELVHRLGKKHKQMLLVGGAAVYSSFLKEDLIDEVYLTIEPVIFGAGKPLFADGEFDSNLKLVSSKKLNKKGTLLLKYIVEK